MQPNLNMVIDQVGKDKNIDRKVLIGTLEQAILQAAKKTFGQDRNLEAKYNVYNYDDFILLDRYYTANVVWFNVAYDLRTK